MSTAEEREVEQRRRDAQRKLESEKALRREAIVRRTKDIGWTALLASVITIIVVTSLGWLTTQGVVEEAREEGAKELVALRASICLVNFQQRADAVAKLAEFKAISSFGEKKSTVEKFVADEGLATMLGEDVPAEGAIDRCANAIARS